MCTIQVPGSRLLGGATLALGILAYGSAVAQEDVPRALPRFPDVFGDTVVFTCGNDLWKAPVAGGDAVRLTVNDGDEQFARFSPDGGTIAFTAQYDGNSDVYVMNAGGGDIRRVTYHPGADVVLGWHPTNGKILFRSDRSSWSRFTRLYLIRPDGTGIEELPLHEAAQGCFSPDGARIAYNRVSREERTWKRYQGGLAQDVYVYDFATGEDRKLTTFEGTDRHPMWLGERIYFVSDRDRTLNLFSLDPESGAVEQLTDHQDHDALRATEGDGGRIVYEKGGQIWLYTTATGEARAIALNVPGDAPEARPFWKDLAEDVTQIDCSPSGKRVALVARGEVFSVPVEEGVTRNLSGSPGAREKDVVWSPDGTRLAWISDLDGEFNLYLRDASAAGPARQLTHYTDGYRHTLRWSPDSTRIAFADQTLRCFILDVESTRVTEVDRSASEPVDIGVDHKPIHDFSWSPDSRFLAYSKIDADLVSRLYVYSTDTGERHCLSGDLFNDFGPVFSTDGRHLFFVSNRRFDPTFCDFEWEMTYKKVAGLYGLSLRKEGPALFPLRNDEEGEPELAKKDEGEAAEMTVEIDLDGIADRVEAFPVPAGNYRELAATKDAVFFLDRESGDFNRFEFREVGERDLKAFSLKDREVSTVLGGVDDYRLAAQGEHIAYRKGSKVGVIPSAARDSKGSDVSLSEVKMLVDPRQEWAQMFAEAWRVERDFYYEPGMHGQDWAALREKYGRLLPAATCRDDLTFLIGEMIGELNTSHTYVTAGESQRTSDRVNVGMLGADWDVDEAAGRYRLRKIYRVPDWTSDVVPPLAQPGLGVEEGQYLLRVNGEEVHTTHSLYRYFQGLAGKQVTLTFATDALGAGAVVARIKPLASERTLRYLDWVEGNRRLVGELSGGLIGYLHLPDTYLGSTREFPKYFYAQTQKKGLVIDGRFNGGGLDPDIFLQRLGKETLAYWTRRYSQEQTTPAVVTRAHMVCLTNRQAGSGGDMLPMEFQQKKLGPVIGTRTWGGLVGVSMFYRLLDGGQLTAPDYRIYDPEGRWVVENEGVTPDIEVDLTPAEMAQGKDAQLLKGVEVLMEAIRRDPREPPPRPDFPADS